MSLILVGATASNEGAADRIWKWQRGGSFHALDFPTGDTGYLAGELLVRGTKNAQGQWFWSQIARDLTDRRSIKALDFHDGQYGSAIGSDNTFAHTGDRGIVWTTPSTPAGVVELMAVRMTSPETVYVTGRSSEGKGLVLRSANRGTTWETLYTSAHEAWLVDFAFFADGRGIVVGYDFTTIANYTGVILEIDASGAVERLSRRRLFFSALAARSDALIAAAYDEDPIGQPGKPTILYSRDGGLSWAEGSVPAGVDRVFDLHWTANQTGWASGTTGEAAVLLQTTDGGASWVFTRSFGDSPYRLSNLSIIGGPDGQTVFTGQTALDGVAPCLNGCPGVVLQSMDAGDSWARAEQLSGIWVEGLSIVSDYLAFEGLILGRTGVDDRWSSMQPSGHPVGMRLRSQHWPEPFVIGPDVEHRFLRWRGLEMVSEQRGWTTADYHLEGARLWYTDDGGMSWSQQTTPYTDRAGRLAAGSTSAIWALGYRSQFDLTTFLTTIEPVLMTTADAGANWELVDQNFGVFNEGSFLEPDFTIANADGRTGCVLGRDRVWCTSDGWATNTSTYLGCTALDVAILDEASILATCFSAGIQVWETTNAGRDWNEVSMIGSSRLTSDELNQSSRHSPLAPVDASKAWMARFNLWGTTDAGRNWVRAEDGIHPDLGISFVAVNERGDGWASTLGGTVLQLQTAQPADVYFCDGFEG